MNRASPLQSEIGCCHLVNHATWTRPGTNISSYWLPRGMWAELWQTTLSVSSIWGRSKISKSLCPSLSLWVLLSIASSTAPVLQPPSAPASPCLVSVFVLECQPHRVWTSVTSAPRSLIILLPSWSFEWVWILTCVLLYIYSALLL